MSRQLPNTVSFHCTACPDKAPDVHADKESLLAMLQLCQAHQDRRFAAGVKARRDADERERAGR